MFPGQKENSQLDTRKPVTKISKLVLTRPVSQKQTTTGGKAVIKSVHTYKTDYYNPQNLETPLAVTEKSHERQKIDKNEIENNGIQRDQHMEQGSSNSVVKHFDKLILEDNFLQKKKDREKLTDEFNNFLAETFNNDTAAATIHSNGNAIISDAMQQKSTLKMDTIINGERKEVVVSPTNKSLIMRNLNESPRSSLLLKTKQSANDGDNAAAAQHKIVDEKPVSTKSKDTDITNKIKSSKTIINSKKPMTPKKVTTATNQDGKDIGNEVNLLTKDKTLNRLEARRYMKAQRKKRFAEMKNANVGCKIEKEIIQKRLNELSRNTRKILGKNLHKKVATKRPDDLIENQINLDEIVKHPNRSVIEDKITENKNFVNVDVAEINEKSISETVSNKLAKIFSKEEHKLINVVPKVDEKIGILRMPDGMNLSSLQIDIDKLQNKTENLINRIDHRSNSQSPPAIHPKIINIEDDLKLKVPETKLQTSSLVTHENKSTTMSNKSNIAKSELPHWLRPTPVNSYPYNFIMAVRKKLEAITHPAVVSRRSILQAKLPSKSSSRNHSNNKENKRASSNENNEKRNKIPRNDTTKWTTRFEEQNRQRKNDIKSPPVLLENAKRDRSKSLSDINTNFSSMTLHMPESNTTSDISSIRSEILPTTHSIFCSTKIHAEKDDLFPQSSSHSMDTIQSDDSFSSILASPHLSPLKKPSVNVTPIADGDKTIVPGASSKVAVVNKNLPSPLSTEVTANLKVQCSIGNDIFDNHETIIKSSNAIKMPQKVNKSHRYNGINGQSNGQPTKTIVSYGKRELELGKSSTRNISSAVLRNPDQENTIPDIDLKDLLKAFNQSLTQVIEVNQQLYSALNSKPEAVDIHIKKYKQLDVDHQQYSESFENTATDSTSYQSQLTSKITEKTDEVFNYEIVDEDSFPSTDKNESTIKTQSNNEKSTSDDTAVAAAAEIRDRSESKEVSVEIDDDRNHDKSLSSVDSDSNYIPTDILESIEQYQTVINNNPPDEAPPKSITSNDSSQSSQIKSITDNNYSMTINHDKEVTNEAGNKNTPSEINKVANSNGNPDDVKDVMSAMPSIRHHQPEISISEMNSTIGSDIFAVFNQSDVEMSFVSTTGGGGGNTTILNETSITYSNIGMFDQLIKTEQTKCDHLTALVKMREKVLIDRTKGQIAWLELQKQKFKEKGLALQISAIRKKQRAILIKLEKDRAELHRAKKSQPENHSTNVSSKDNSKLKIMQNLHNVVNLRKSPTTLVKTQNQAFKGYEIETGSSLDKMLEQRECELQKRRQHVEYLIKWHQRLDKEEKDILRMEQKLMSCNLDKLANQKLKNEMAMQQSPRHLSLTNNESDLDQRQLATYKKVKNIEKSLRVLQNISSSLDDSNVEDSVETSGTRLNRLWKRLTGHAENKFEAEKNYKLLKKDLSKLYEDARQVVLDDFEKGNEMKPLLEESTITEKSSSVSGREAIQTVDEKSPSASSHNVATNENYDEEEKGNSVKIIENEKIDDIVEKTVSLDDEDHYTTDNFENGLVSSDNSSGTVDNNTSETDKITEDIQTTIDEESDKNIVSSLDLSFVENQDSTSMETSDEVNFYCPSSATIMEDKSHPTVNFENSKEHDEPESSIIVSEAIIPSKNNSSDHPVQEEISVVTERETETDGQVSADKEYNSINDILQETSVSEQLIEDITFPNFESTLGDVNDDNSNFDIVNEDKRIDDNDDLSNSFERSANTDLSGASKSDKQDSETMLSTNSGQSNFNATSSCINHVNDDENLPMRKSPDRCSSSSPTIHSELEQRLVSIDDSLKDLNCTLDKAPILELSPRTPEKSPNVSLYSNEDIMEVLNDTIKSDSIGESSPDSKELKSFVENSVEENEKKCLEAKQNNENSKLEIKMRNKNINETFPIDVYPKTGEELPICGSSSKEKSPSVMRDFVPSEFKIPNRMPDIISEAEVLRRQQMQIEQEIKQLEQAVPYVFLREIPNKPPPPYVPPAHGSPLAAIFPADDRIEEIVNRRTKELYCEFIETNNEYLTDTLPSILDESITNIYERMILEVCKETVLEYKATVSSSLTGQPFKNQLAFHDPPNTLNCIQNYVLKTVKKLLVGNNGNRPPPSTILGCSRRKRDQVDEILLQEMLEDDSKWTNFRLEETEVINTLTQDIANFLIEEAVLEIEVAFYQKLKST